MAALLSFFWAKAAPFLLSLTSVSYTHLDVGLPLALQPQPQQRTVERVQHVRPDAEASDEHAAQFVARCQHGHGHGQRQGVVERFSALLPFHVGERRAVGVLDDLAEDGPG